MSFVLLKPSSFTSINMRAVALLCLLHVAFGQQAQDRTTYSWDGPGRTTLTPQPNAASACHLDQASCGCCLMQKQAKRMESYFNISYESLNMEMTKTKMMLDNYRASRSAFSVALNNEPNLDCFGPFSRDMPIIYRHVFLTLEQNFNLQSGIFTAPRSGVYSFSVTIYSSGSSSVFPCAKLQVNSNVVAELSEHNGQDHEDSGTIVVALKVQAGDQVSVILPRGCIICDHDSHYNTFTGFLLYPV